MSLSVNDVIHWFRDLPWANDVDVQFIERYRQQVWKRDQGAPGQCPSGGAMAYYHTQMFAAIIERFDTIGRLPAGPAEQFAAETIQAFEIGLPRAVAAYRTAQEPGPEDVQDPPTDPGQQPPAQGSPFGNRWTNSGVDFMQDGQRRKYLGVTGFTLYQDFLDGRDRTDYLRFMKPYGFNFVRVFGMWGKNGTMFDARAYGDRYYSRFPEFAKWAGSEGFGVHFVDWTDQVPGSGVNWDDDDASRGAREGHHRRMQDLKAAQPNVIGEDINEFDQNGKLVFAVPTPIGLLRTRSTWVDGDTWQSVGGLLGYTTEHTPRDNQTDRKAKNLYETSKQGLAPPDKPAVPATNEPAIGGEPQRIELLSPMQVEAFFSIALGMGSGACAHGDPQTFQRCRIPTDPSVLQKLDILRQVIADPPGFEFHGQGQYSRGGLGDCPVVHYDRYNDNNDGNVEVDPRGTRRTYALLLADRAIVMVSDPGSQWASALQGAHGWSIVRHHGTPYGLTVDLQR